MADPAFARAADQFRAAVAAGEERGALAVRVAGRTVLDLHGGAADPGTGTPWQADTLACCFSVTKGVFALLVQRLAATGRLSLDAAVAGCWPDFAARGKSAITVRDVLTHRAGLPAVDGPVAPGLLYAPQAMAAALAASAPVVPPRAAPVYHNMTYGTLLAEIVRRATGDDAADLIEREIARPLGADFAIGLGMADRARAARLTQDDPGGLFRALAAEPEGLFARSMASFDPHEDFNSGRWRGTVIGSGSGHATALGIARIYEALIAGPLLPPERRAAIGQEVARTKHDPVLGLPLRLGEGVELSEPPGLDFGPSPRAMGYWGAGGAQGVADPDAGLAVGYVTGHMAAGLGSAPRLRRYLAEVYACL